MVYFQKNNIIYNIILYYTIPLSSINYNIDNYNSNIDKSENEDNNKDILIIEDLL